ncbi:MAG: PD-(D/E)XK nuclease family protein [Myxococcota bacterium]
MGTVWLSPGAQATAQHLDEELDVLLPQDASLLDRLGQSVFVVVPSVALQLHLSARFAARPRVGLRVVTLAGLATEILRRHNEIPRRGAPMARVLARRFSAEEPVLAAELDHLVDGYSAAVNSVRDLLESGFEPIHLEATDELLSNAADEETRIAAALGLPIPQSSATTDDGTAEQRAAAILRVAAQVYEALDLLKVGERSWIFRRAVELLPITPPLARSIRIAGFAEATGLMGDFIEGLMRWPDTDVILDQPADPAASWRLDASVAFTEPFLGRLQQVGAIKELPVDNSAPQRVLMTAPGAGAEVRAVAQRVRRLLDDGVAPERVAIVARTVELYRPMLWRELRRLGVPFSGLEALGSDSIEARRVGALIDVLCEGPDVRADRWLESCGWLTETPGQDERAENRLRRADLVLAFSAAGVSRLHEVPEMVPARADEVGVRLPVREGFVLQPDGRVRAERRVLLHSRLGQAKDRARRLCAFWEDWPEKAPLEDHVQRLRRMLRRELSWDGEPIAAAEVADAVSELLRVHEPKLAITLEEFRLLTLSHLRRIGRNALGGQGGGVQVLSAVEARGMTFDHLFLIGLNRDLFPKRGGEDALLSDRMRRRLHVLLPTLPLRAQSYLGERFLFAWLHTAARNLTVSWQRMDEDGKPIAPSPMVERLRWSRAGAAKIIELPAVHSGLSPAGDELAFDHAVRAGLHGSRERFSMILPLVLEEVRGKKKAAQARLSVLNALEPPRDQGDRSDPFSGLIGPMLDPNDPRRNPLYITTLENVARCSWQAFLLQMLRIEPVPDPIHSLPNVEKWMLGDLVHRVLEEIVRDGLGDEAQAREVLAQAVRLGAVDVPWPGEAVYSSAIARVTSASVRELGMNLPGMRLVLKDMAEPFLDIAKNVDWPEPDSTISVLGVETEGEVDAEAGGRPVYFKADRADLEGGRLRLTDYKTGRPIHTGKMPETRLRNFLKQVRSGKRLQASTYTLAQVDGLPERVGRFLFLNPESEEYARDFSVEGGDRDFMDATGEAFSAVIAAWDQGVFFPRVVDPGGLRQGDACKSCDARQACRLGDSGFRQRTVDGIRRRTAAFKNSALSGIEHTRLRLWWLGETPPDYEESDVS